MIWLLLSIILICLALALMVVLWYRRAMYRPHEYINSPHQDRIRELERRLAEHIASREKNARDRERLRTHYESLLAEYTTRMKVSDGSIEQIQQLVRDRAVLDRIESELQIKPRRD
ncbi:MAG: hypothetical protein CBC35_10650 [Planctomycetes bacterium TMED75]|nr:hypothetical protein [Planctomycetaceae bacterium]OUU90860.1 MAG: hypothetical protein CBC35_10650 [Planctomycetes bacterium TMED75]